MKRKRNDPKRQFIQTKDKDKKKKPKYQSQKQDEKLENLLEKENKEINEENVLFNQKDFEEAKNRYEAKAKEGSVEAMYRLGLWYIDQNIKPPQGQTYLQAASFWFKEAKNKKHGISKFMLIIINLYSAKKRKDEVAVQHWESRAEKFLDNLDRRERPDKECLAICNYRYAKYLLDTAQETKALEFLKIASESDSYEAMKVYGACLLRQECFKESIELTLKAWRREDYKHKDYAAAYQLGNAHHELKEFNDAFSYYLKAALGGHTGAMLALAEYHEIGRVISKKTRINAIEWCKKAEDEKTKKTLEEAGVRTFYSDYQNYFQSNNLQEINKNLAIKWYKTAGETAAKKINKEDVCNEGFGFINVSRILLFDKKDLEFQKINKYLKKSFACENAVRRIIKNIMQECQDTEANDLKPYENIILVKDCFILSLVFEIGIGAIKKDIAQAEKYYNQALGLANKFNLQKDQWVESLISFKNYMAENPSTSSVNNQESLSDNEENQKKLLQVTPDINSQSYTAFFPSQSDKALLEGYLPNETEPLYFNEEEVLGDGNCGFTTIGATREQLASVLRDLSDDAESRESLYEEIAQALQEKQMQTEEGAKLIEELFALRAEESNQITFLREQYAAFPHFVDETLNNSINWLNENGYPKIARKLKKQCLKTEKANNIFLNYCKSKEAFLAYIDELEKNKELWLGYKSALLYAKAIDITLYIWAKTKEDNKKLNLLEFYVGKNSQIIHMLSTNRITHFNLLVKATQPSANESRNGQQKRSDKDINTEDFEKNLVSSIRKKFTFFKFYSKEHRKYKGKPNKETLSCWENEESIEKLTPARPENYKQGPYIEYQAYLFFINYYLWKYGTESSFAKTTNAICEKVNYEIIQSLNETPDKNFDGIRVIGQKKKGKIVTITWLNKQKNSQPGNRDIEICKSKEDDPTYVRRYYIDVKSHKKQDNARKPSYTRSEADLILKVHEYNIRYLTSSETVSLNPKDTNSIKTIICQRRDKELVLFFINKENRCAQISLELEKKEILYLNYLKSCNTENLIPINREDNKFLFDSIKLACIDQIKKTEDYKICQVVGLYGVKDDMEFRIKHPPFTNKDELFDYSQEFRVGFKKRPGYN